MIKLNQRPTVGSSLPIIIVFKDSLGKKYVPQKVNWTYLALNDDNEKWSVIDNIYQKELEAESAIKITLESNLIRLIYGTKNLRKIIITWEALVHGSVSTFIDEISFEVSMSTTKIASSQSLDIRSEVIELMMLIGDEDFGYETVTKALVGHNEKLESLQSELDDFEEETESDISDLNSELSAFKTQTASNFTSVNDSISNLQTSLESDINDVASDLSSFETETGNNFTSVNNSISALESSLTDDIDSVESELSSFKTQTASNFTNTNNSISALETSLGNDIDSVENDLSSFKTQTAGNFTSVNNSISALESSLGSDIDDVSDELSSFKTETGNNFTSVNNSISSLETSLGNDIDSVESELSSFKTQTGNNFTAVNNSISSLESSLGDDIDSVESDLSSFKTQTAVNFTSVNNSISALESDTEDKFDEVEGSISSLSSITDSRFSDVNTAIGRVEGSISSLSESTTNRFTQTETSISDFKTETATNFTNVNSSLNDRYTKSETNGLLDNKQDNISCDKGIEIKNNVVSHTNSITSATKGGVTKIPQITYDAQGHITGVTEKTVYPPTSDGENGQYWVSDGDGAGYWRTLIGSIDDTENLEQAIKASAVKTAIEDAKTYASNLFATVTNGLVEFVDELPTENISDHTIYLLKKPDSTEENNKYDEYVHKNGVWEKFGTQMIDITPYAKTEDVNNALALKANSADVYTKTAANEIFNTKAEKSELESAVNTLEGEISNKANSSDVPTKVSDLENDSGYLNTTEVNSLISSGVSGKANSSDVYTKLESDALLSVKATTSSVSALETGKADKSEIPTKVSQLENDNGYLTEHQDISGKQDSLNTTQMSAVNSGITSDKVSAYDAYATGKADKSEIPTKVSELENDSDYVDKEYVDSVGVATVNLTRAEYDALSESDKMKNIYYNITDDAISSDISVHTIPQTLSDTQKENARNNIGVGNFITDVDSFKQAILDLTYPVGSIYSSTNNVSPQTFLGGTWEALEDKFLVGKGSTFTTQGGHKEITLNSENMPRHNHKMKHTHDAGTMKIEGYFDAQAYTTGNTCTGAFEPARYGYIDSGTSQSSNYVNRVHLRADRYYGWSGNTSEPSSTYTDETGGTPYLNTTEEAYYTKPFETVPPYLAVYMWKRTE